MNQRYICISKRVNFKSIQWITRNVSKWHPVFWDSIFISYSNLTESNLNKACRKIRQTRLTYKTQDLMARLGTSLLHSTRLVFWKKYRFILFLLTVSNWLYSRSFLQRQKVITSKSPSKNLSSENKHWYFWCLQDNLFSLLRFFDEFFDVINDNHFLTL